MSFLNSTVKIRRGTNVVVTGASGGVGRAVARMLGQRGANVVLIARGREGLEAAKREVEELGGSALVLPMDISDPAAVEAAAAQAEQSFGPIDLWVNNAMVSMYSPFMKMEPNEFKHIIDVTLMGYVYGVQSALKRMIPRDRGVIVNVGSALAFRSIPLQSAYCAAKHGIQGFVESVRSELMHNGSHIRVCAVNLPAMNTTQFKWTKNKMPNKPRPCGTIYQPEVAADAVLFAAENDRREIMVGYPTVESTVAEKFIPGFLDHYLSHAAWEGAFIDEPADPNQRDNFWAPVAHDEGSHGPFDELSHSTSPQMWLNKNRGKVIGGLLAAGIGAALFAASERRH